MQDSSWKLTPRFPVFLHGGDYNPDQWLDRPDILEQDVVLMQEAHVNCVSLGIFSWAKLEPEEGVYDFEWLDRVIDRLWTAGIRVDLATPSGARPPWMAQKYPEVLRVNDHFQRNHFGNRHNHCPSSPVYREKVRAMDTALAQRYGKHPAVILWHISNEFSGDCWCERCQERFRTWLKDRYGTLEKLNHAWWTGFWSQTYTDWSQIEPPSPMGQTSNLGMQMDWRRFSTWNCCDFIRMERETVKAITPDLPVTANLMERFYDYDYFQLARELDVVSWDSYPDWHSADPVGKAAEFAMNHDMMRSLKDQPFLLMESTPSLVNWKPVNKLKRPGMHLLSSLQAVAHGSQSVMYFQWRKGRGGVEMFHGAVVDHDGRSDHRVFQDVRQVGLSLERLQPLYSRESAPAKACILYDWDNMWALNFVQAGQKGNMRYFDTVNMHYRALWQLGVKVDFRDQKWDTDFSQYDLVIAPLMFMTENGIEERLRCFVERGGTLLTTYFSGVVDENDLAHLGDTPHGLTEVLGLRAPELDSLYPEESVPIRMADGQVFQGRELCQLVIPQGAETVATYGGQFYEGTPCITRNAYGKGEAWYVAVRAEQACLDAIYAELVKKLHLPQALGEMLPEGVVALERSGVIFLQNYSEKQQTVTLNGHYLELLTGAGVSGEITLKKCGVMVLEKQD